jgi:hypothetical protein
LILARVFSGVGVWSLYVIGGFFAKKKCWVVSILLGAMITFFLKQSRGLKLNFP